LFDEVIVHCEILDRWHTDRTDDAYATETGRMFQPDVVDELHTLWNQPVTKLMFLGDPRIISRIEPALMAAVGEHVTIVHMEAELLQIMDNRASKAIALAKVTQHYGLRLSQVLAIGDAPNDVDMLQEAGVGVAMGNAHQVVKDVADWVAPSNDDRGVHAALARYGLCG
jgi:Cof subfamily protein (haloacid dehalogenase superfamily)